MFICSFCIWEKKQGFCVSNVQLLFPSSIAQPFSSVTLLAALCLELNKRKEEGGGQFCLFTVIHNSVVSHHNEQLSQILNQLHRAQSHLQTSRDSDNYHSESCHAEKLGKAFPSLIQICLEEYQSFLQHSQPSEQRSAESISNLASVTMSINVTPRNKSMNLNCISVFQKKQNFTKTKTKTSEFLLFSR